MLRVLILGYTSPQISFEIKKYLCTRYAILKSSPQKKTFADYDIPIVGFLGGSKSLNKYAL